MAHLMHTCAPLCSSSMRAFLLDACIDDLNSVLGSIMRALCEEDTLSTEQSDALLSQCQLDMNLKMVRHGCTASVLMALHDWLWLDLEVHLT